MKKIDILGIKTARRSMSASLLAFLVSFSASSQVWALASAIAYSSDKGWGWATKATQEEANRAALKGCNESASIKDCVLDVTKAVVRAEGGGGIGFGKSSVSLAEAKQNALASCGNKKCKVVFETTKPGFYSLSKSEKDENGNGDFYLAYQYTNSDKADQDAKEGCENLTGQKCTNRLMQNPVNDPVTHLS